MADTLIATRDGDRLFATGSQTNSDGVKIFFGYIMTENGGRIEVPNVDVLIGHGYWQEIVD